MIYHSRSDKISCFARKPLPLIIRLQHFKVKRRGLRYFSPFLQVAFKHKKSAPLETDENLEKDGEKEILQERSGNPYYKIGFPLITGRLDEDKVKPIDTWVWSSTKIQ